MTNRSQRVRQRGFTLIEVIIVVSIIAMLSAVGASAYNKVQLQARATKIVNDYKTIKEAWRIWSVKNTPGIYPLENTYASNPAVCGGDPFVSQTQAQGYLDSMILDPWGVEYTYDNDGDTLSGTLGTGVNIAIPWCAGNGQKIISVAAIVDDLMDNSNGSATGIVRWNTNPAAAGILFMNFAVNSNG